jgi:hypothetical protein
MKPFLLRSSIQRDRLSLMQLTEDELGIIAFALDHYARSGDYPIMQEAGDLARRIVYQYLHCEESLSSPRTARMDSYRRHLMEKGRSCAAGSGDHAEEAQS